MTIEEEFRAYKLKTDGDIVGLRNAIQLLSDKLNMHFPEFTAEEIAAKTKEEEIVELAIRQAKEDNARIYKEEDAKIKKQALNEIDEFNDILAQKEGELYKEPSISDEDTSS